MIKIDSLRALSIVVLLMAAFLLIVEIKDNTSHEGWPIPILIILSVALERIRVELREIREEIQKQRQ